MMAGFAAAFLITWILSLMSPLLEIIFYGLERVSDLILNRVIKVWAGEDASLSAFDRGSVYLLGYILLFILMELFLKIPHFILD